MATARREQVRIQAMNFAQCFGTAKKVDWERFVRTGQFDEYQRASIPSTPLFVAAVERLKRWQKTGRLEENN